LSETFQGAGGKKILAALAYRILMFVVFLRPTASEEVGHQRDAKLFTLFCTYTVAF